MPLQINHIGTNAAANRYILNDFMTILRTSGAGHATAAAAVAATALNARHFFQMRQYAEIIHLIC